MNDDYKYDMDALREWKKDNDKYPDNCTMTKIEQFFIEKTDQKMRVCDLCKFNPIAYVFGNADKGGDISIYFCDDCEYGFQCERFGIRATARLNV